MTYASLTSVGRNTYKRNQNNTSYSARVRVLGPVSNFIVLLILVFLLAVIYLSQVAKTNSYSFPLDSLTQQKAQSQEQLDNLRVETAHLVSSKALSSNQAISNLVDPKQVNSY